jgi:hypothetical protein
MVLAHLKSNLAPRAPSLGHAIESDPRFGCGRIKWLGEVGQDADATVRPEPGEERGALAEAIEFRRQVLADKPLPATVVQSEARDAGSRTPHCDAPSSASE